MPPLSIPTSADVELKALRERVAEIDRRSDGSAALAQRARGVIAVSRRNTGLSGITGAGSRWKVADISCPTEPDRLYRVAGRLFVNADGARGSMTLLDGEAFATLDGSDPVVPTTVNMYQQFAHTNVLLPGGFLTHYMQFEEFVDTIGHTGPRQLRVTFAVRPYDNGRTYNVVGSSDAQGNPYVGNPVFWIEDVGPGYSGRPQAMTIPGSGDVTGGTATP